MLPGKIAPSMMCANFLRLEEDIRALEQAKVEFLHLDIMDNHFVSNITLCPDMVAAIRSATHVPLDIHLMIERPEKSLGLFQFAENDIVCIHYESTPHVHRALACIRDAGARPGIALNPATPLCVIEEIIQDIDLLLIMTVNPGFSGQKLVPSTLQKISKARKMLDDAGRSDVFLEVDGNVSFENAKKMRAQGADVFVGGTTSVFNQELGIPCAVEKLRENIR